MGIAEQQKQAVGERAAAYVEDGMTIGLGSGSTMYWMLKTLGERVQGGLRVKGIPSSRKTENWAKEFGIPLTTFAEAPRLDLAVDGADEVDPDFQLIKGGGGSLLREKLVAAATDELIVIVDESKLTDRLGRFPLPVEVVPFAWENTCRAIASLGCTPEVRRRNGDVFVTDNANVILDCAFGRIDDPEALHRQLKQLTGVVETGLFVHMAKQIIVGRASGLDVLRKPSADA